MHGSDCEIAIVGAGMAGLACATRLRMAGCRVKVFDKGRGPGGRMATRRVEVAGEVVRFDHGAQYFTARDPGFRAVVDKWEEQGAVARWAAASKSEDDPAFVGTPGMNGPIKAMADGLKVLWNTRVVALSHSEGTWLIDTGAEVFNADTVLVAIPAEQASELLSGPAPELAALSASVASAPCWAVMATFDERLESDKDILRDRQARISWAARNSAKPMRTGPESWLLHASLGRSREVLDLAKEEAADALLADFFAQTGMMPVEPIHLSAHRWLYAQPASLKGEPAYFDASLRIGIAGDYLHSPRVEGAWLSGTALADLALA